MGKPERKRPLERPRRRLEDNIKIDLQELGTQESLYIAATRFGLSDFRRPAALWRTPKRQPDRHLLQHEASPVQMLDGLCCPNVKTQLMEREACRLVSSSGRFKASQCHRNVDRCVPIGTT